MTFEELNRAIEFIVEQQARLSATLDRDHEWSRGMIQQLAQSNQHVVELIASNAQRLDESDRRFDELHRESARRHEEAMARLDRILDRLVRDNPNPN
jgi:hypothetical protein